MKRPSIAFNQEAIVDFLLRHGEKFLVAVIGLAALGLAWGAFDAVRSKSASAQQRPEAILRQADEAARHIDRDKTPPAGEKWSGQPLATAIDPWRNPSVAAPPQLALLDRPLFEELAKRTQPDVFPIEDLRAVAGLAVLPSKAPAAEPAAAERPRPRPRGRDGEPAAGGQPGDQAGGQPGTGAVADKPRGRIAPYAVVTGLIPVSKQVAEYSHRFESVGFKDAKRDSPLWADWTIERTVVGAEGERWEPIDLVDAGRRWQAEWSGLAGDKVPDAYLLSAAEDKRNPKTTPPYCGPLPQLLRGSWGVSSLHPWVVEQVRQPPDAGAAGGAEFKLFRFIDTSVEPGKSYRYQVQAVVKAGAGTAVSEPTAEAAVPYVDRFPPAQPVRLNVIASANAIELSWERNTEADLKHYRVWRDGQVLADAIDVPAYTDRTAARGKSYRYAVSAVDLYGNESSPSQPVEITIP